MSIHAFQASLWDDSRMTGTIIYRLDKNCPILFAQTLAFDEPLIMSGQEERIVAHQTSHSDSGTESCISRDEVDLFGAMSPGMVQMKFIREILGRRDYVCIFGCLLLLGTAYGLEGLLRPVY